MASMNDEEESSSAQARLREDIGAITFFATRLGDVGSEAAAFASAQRKAMGLGKAMTSADVALITRLTMPTAFAGLKALGPALMAEAESDTMFNGSKKIEQRLARASTAVAVALQMELLLRPGQIQKCRIIGKPAEIASFHDADGAVTTTPMMELSKGTVDLVGRWNDVRDHLGLSSEWLYARADLTGPQAQESVATSFARVMQAHGFKGVTLQTLRDASAVMMIRAKPNDLRRVMMLLRVTSVRTVSRRYAPFLKGVW